MVTENKEQAEKLYADFMEWRLMDNPEYGTNYGIHTYDDMTSQWTEEHFIQRMVCPDLLHSTLKGIIYNCENIDLLCFETKATNS